MPISTRLNLVAAAREGFSLTSKICRASHHRAEVHFFWVVRGDNAALLVERCSYNLLRILAHAAQICVPWHLSLVLCETVRHISHRLSWLYREAMDAFGGDFCHKLSQCDVRLCRIWILISRPHDAIEPFLLISLLHRWLWTQNLKLLARLWWGVLDYASAAFGVYTTFLVLAWLGDTTFTNSNPTGVTHQLCVSKDIRLRVLSESWLD